MRCRAGRGGASRSTGRIASTGPPRCRALRGADQRRDPETGPVDVDLSEAAESGHISRQHGEIYRESNGSWMVRDLGSTNGVFVKSSADASFGPRITAPRPLKDGDEVVFGNARFIFKSS